MKFQIKLILFFILIHFTVYPSFVFLSWNEDRIEFDELQQHYNWLNKDVYYLILEKSNKYKINSKFICSVIQAESNGKNVRSKFNRNGSRDFGLMQINSCWGNPKELMQLPINLEIGSRYLSFCFEKAKGDYSTTIRYYNQGHNGKESTYKNWRYVNRVLSNMLIAGL